MKDTWKILLLIFSVINLQSSCKEPITPEPQPVLPDSLPPITTEGKNTFGCLVNDTLWLPSKRFDTPFADYKEGMLIVYADKYSFNTPINTVSISTGYNTIKDTGKYKLSLYSNTKIGSFYSIKEKYYFTDNTHIGELTILKLDSINRIVSGTFYFTGFDKNTGDSVSIKDGRFDIHY